MIIALMTELKIVSGEKLKLKIKMETTLHLHDIIDIYLYI